MNWSNGAPSAAAPTVAIESPIVAWAMEAQTEFETDAPTGPETLTDAPPSVLTRQKGQIIIVIITLGIEHPVLDTML